VLGWLPSDDYDTSWGQAVRVTSLHGSFNGGATRLDGPSERPVSSHVWAMVGKRLLATVPILVMVSFVVFTMTYLIPGDAAAVIAGESATREQVEAVRGELGLNDPFIIRYLEWAGSAIRGDFGLSISQGRPVGVLIAEALPATMQLAVGSMLIAVFLGLPLGMIAASKPGSLWDRGSVVLASIGLAVPSFWLGVMLVAVFSVTLGWLPTAGYVPLTEGFEEWAGHLVLPVVALGVTGAAELMRQTRSSLSSVLQNDYIRTAQMKGLPPRVVVAKHGMKNASLPVVTAFGLQAAVILGGTAVIESVFAISGVGRLAVAAISTRDMPVVQGVALLVTVMAVTVNLLMDLVTMYLNPKLDLS